MPEPRSVAWLLAPAELIAACELLDIAGLPHSAYVDESIEHPAYLAGTGRRALAISRLAATSEAGESMQVEAGLADALWSLTGDEQDAVASLSMHHDHLHVATFRGERATTMIESDAGVEIIAEPSAHALARLEQRLAELRVLATAVGAGGVPRAEGSAKMTLDRWQAIGGGRPARSADAPLAAEAAQAGAAMGVWEGACLIVRPDGSYEGCTGGWVFDDRGLMAVEPEQDPADDEIRLVIRAITDIEAELDPLWQPLRDAAGNGWGSPALPR